MLAVVLASALAVGCGGHERDSRHAAAAKTPPAVAGPGKLVAIGGGRSLFLDCLGSGSPSGRTTRTCSYDRAGNGSSVGRPGVRDARDDIDDLQRLLNGAHLEPPYVLVGHSYGGLLVRLFAHEHPQETAGVVLVDAKGRDQTRRELAIWPKSQAPALRRAWARPIREGVDLATGDALARRVTSLGDAPLAVITAGTHKADSRGMPPSLARALYRLWVTMQDELAAQSGNHVHVVARRSDHWVAIRRFYGGNQQIDGQPEIVVRAVKAVVAAARDGTPLSPCRQLFHDLVADCRD
jgi:pimeloyl-ACP methyl ester carboxylesterase